MSLSDTQYGGCESRGFALRTLPGGGHNGGTQPVWQVLSRPQRMAGGSLVRLSRPSATSMVVERSQHSLQRICRQPDWLLILRFVLNALAFLAPRIMDLGRDGRTVSLLDARLYDRVAHRSSFFSASAHSVCIIRFACR